MRTTLTTLALLWVSAWATAMGLSEDPQEKLTQSWELEAVRTLEVRGQVDFELVPGPVPRVTVETTRALFDQLTVSNWWGAATVAIESGLRGPRELGEVKVLIELPELSELNLSDRSHGRGVWPGPWGTLRVTDRSTANFVLEGTNFSLETSWLTKVTLAGTLARLRADLRHESLVDATSLSVDEAVVSLNEGSTYEAGPTGRGSGLARHRSRVIVEDDLAWRGLALKEDSARRLRTEATAR